MTVFLASIDGAELWKPMKKVHARCVGGLGAIDVTCLHAT